MKISLWFSDTFRKLSSREKVIVAGGTVVSVAALVGVYVVAPLAARWSEREAEIQLRAEQVARLKSLIEHEDDIRAAVESLREERSYAGRRLLEGNTAAIAASGLQQLINRYAEESNVSLDRVDVAGDLQPEASELIAIPARLSGRTDIYGLVDILFYLQQGEKVLVIDELRVGSTRASASSADLVTWSLDLHGYYASAQDSDR